MTREADLIGRDIGQVKILQEIGSGGMGVVYKARHKILGTDHAVKVLHPEYASNKKILERFRREALAIRSLQHDNVVFVLDFGWEQGIGAYQIMELLDGISLYQAIKEKQAFGKERLANFVTQVASVLECAHENSILHRDLKPDNIFLCVRHGKQERVKVLDFGIAKVVQEVSNKLTRTGVALGTPQYMSPEQAAGNWEDVDHRSDIYAFASVIYEMLAGKPPVTSNHFTEALVKQTNGDLTPLRMYRPDLDGHYLEQVIHWALAFNREQRPPTAGDFLRELLVAIEALPDEGGSVDTFVDAEEDTGSEFDTQYMPSLSSAPPPSIDPKALEPLPFADTSVPDGALLQDHIFSTQLQAFHQIAPGTFKDEAMRGSVILDITGHVLSSQGFFPEVCVQGVHLVDGICQQLQAARPNGSWRHGFIETKENVMGVFPYLDDVAGMIFGCPEQRESMALDGYVQNSQHTSQEQAQAVVQLASVSGVEAVALFSLDGQLMSHYGLPVEGMDRFVLSFTPVVQAFFSLPFDARGLDVWFEDGRVLAWQLEQIGVLFVFSQKMINKLMLSVLIGRHYVSLIQQCITPVTILPETGPPLSGLGESHGLSSAETEDLPPELAAQVLDMPDCAAALEELEQEYTKHIGPMAKLVVKKTIKKMGFTRKTIPFGELPQLVQQLAGRLNEPKKSDFLAKGAVLSRRK